MDLKLTGKTAVVTGGGSGIGRGIVLRLAAEGATVVVPDLAGEEAEKVIAEIVARGGSGMAIQANAANEREIDRIVAKTKEVYGAIDILVNNVAGGAGPIPIAQMAVQDWDRVMELTLKSTFLCLPRRSPGNDSPETGEDHQHIIACRQDGRTPDGTLQRGQVRRRGSDSGPGQGTGTLFDYGRRRLPGLHLHSGIRTAWPNI